MYLLSCNQIWILVPIIMRLMNKYKKLLFDVEDIK